MKKETPTSKPTKKPVKEEPQMESPFAEKDEVKRAEDKMRNSAGKNGK